MRLLLLALVVLALSACARSEADMVRARAASDLQCDARNVTIQPSATPFPRETLYRVSGCGRATVYRCTQPVTDELQRSMPTPAESRTVCQVDAPSGTSAP